MSIPFQETRMGRKLIEADIPRLIEAVEKLAEAVEKLVEERENGDGGNRK